ncbi:hypothetical protein BMS3Abin10_01472 [bacterium BMS3Abin10]|nr:hypothetical protein BMS3Abin10_01472 [bacterium BMS3Abin10]GBE39598.1 hypothetical protein BMS3Bbin08_02224 [bacterium BMS3Bbin08]
MKTKRRQERRRPVICPYCATEMKCMNRFESVYQRIDGFYVWYVCPRRRGENGCGHSVLLEISPKTKSPGRTVSEIKFKEKGSKGRARK